MKNTPSDTPRRAAVAWRIAWTIITLTAVQAWVCGVSALPVVLIWSMLGNTISNQSLQLIVLSGAIVPSYVLFALCVTIVSPLTLRLLGWRTPPDHEMPMAEMGWPLLGWVRYLASLHVARVLAGTLFRGSPIWTVHLRLNGARLGKQVYVNSLAVSDYNLLECGDKVVIGGAVHLSGHTVEHGVVKTGSVRLGSNVTVGLGSIIEIGATVGSDCQIGALSFVPKHTNIPGGGIYAGVPAKRIE